MFRGIPGSNKCVPLPAAHVPQEMPLNGLAFTILKCQVDKINQIFAQANTLLYKVWLSDILFKWHWWMELLLTIGVWLLWIILRKKESTDRLLLPGLAIGLLSIITNIIGMAFGFWKYYTALVPIIPPLRKYKLLLYL